MSLGAERNDSPALLKLLARVDDGMLPGDRTVAYVLLVPMAAAYEVLGVEGEGSAELGRNWCHRQM